MFARVKKIVLGLKAKLFLLVFIGFSLLLMVTSWRVGEIAEVVANETIQTTLKQSEISLDAKLGSRFDAIEETAKNFARDGRLLPLVYESDSVTLQDLSLEFEKSLNFDSLIFTNAGGDILARSDRPEAIGLRMAGRSKLFDQALSGQISQGMIVSKGKILQMVVVPIRDNYAKDIVRGTVAMAYELSPKMANEIHELTQGDIGFYYFTRDKKREISGVMSTYNSKHSLASKLDSYFDANPQLWKDILYTEDMLENVSIIIDGDELFAVIKPLKSNGGKTLGFILSLRSKTELMAPYSAIQNQLLLVGIICLIVASLIAAFIAANISRPIIDLVGISEKIQQGEYPSMEGIKFSGGEVGVLQRAIYQMGKNLKDKADLETYLADLSSSLGDDSIIIDAQNLEINLSGEDLAVASNSTIDISIRKNDETGLATPVDRVITAPGKFSASKASEDITEKVSIDHSVTLQGGDESLFGSNEALELARGTVINNRYVISSLIGSGAMADVYLANDTDLNELIAIKLISHNGMQDIEHLRQEIRLARKITHRNILRTFDFGHVNNDFYITMEFVHGFSLESLISQRGRLDAHIGLIMAKQIALAIGAAHEQGIIHRDLKPGNMMINKQGILKIMDFGLAKTLQDGRETDSNVSGTPRFMAPEQFIGKALDQRTDIYAVGVILYVIFTGRSPYQADSFKGWARAHTHDEIPKASLLVPNIDKRIDNIITKAMQKKQDDRYDSIKNLLNDLEELS